MDKKTIRAIEGLVVASMFAAFKIHQLHTVRKLRLEKENRIVWAVNTLPDNEAIDVALAFNDIVKDIEL